jgi:hypothetical protein
LKRILFFDVDVESVKADTNVLTDVLCEADRLVMPVEKVGFESVERFKCDLNVALSGVLGDLLEAFYGPTPFGFRVGHGNDFADFTGNQRKDLAPKVTNQRDRVIEILDGSFPLHGVTVDEVALLEHDRNTAPAFDPVLLEQGTNFRSVITLWFAHDLDPFVAESRQAIESNLKRLRPHPVVGSESETHRSISSWFTSV